MAKPKTTTETNTPPANPDEMKNLTPDVTPDATPIPPEPAQQTFTMEDVRKMMAEFVAKVNVQNGGTKEEQEVDPNRHTVRISRLEAKFVVDFKDMNDDPYQDKIIHSFNKWDERERLWIAWITLVFQDGSEKEVPLKYFVENSVGVSCDIVETIKKDTSYSLGKVERQVIKSYHPEGTGVLVDQKVTSYSTTYKVKTPKGELITVPEYVVNIAGAPTPIHR